ncbi:unnamed protein product [Trichobilharzia szidati]|nr:unnamed protein product [Trichobilharzia szidati]
MPRYPPDRWFDYSPFGVPLKGTRFLPLKLPIPLEKAFNIPPHLRFSLNDLLGHVQSYNQYLACVIDLTYTKYYSTKFLHDNNIRYHKIYVEGHKIPDSKSVAKFFDLVNEERKQSPDGIIAVHCTHGVNRTGYFICRYLIDYMKWDPKDALQEFEYARGHPVERENYIEDLMSSVDKSKSKVDVEENQSE